jgi:hypothetical protein
MKNYQEDKDLLVTDLDLLKSAYSEKDLERITESTEKLNATWATIILKCTKRVRQKSQ